MKCWECKKEISTAHMVHYYSQWQNKEATRYICADCVVKLPFNACHFVEVEKITQRALYRKTKAAATC
jgi:hypothetical protein